MAGNYRRPRLLEIRWPSEILERIENGCRPEEFCDKLLIIKVLRSTEPSNHPPPGYLSPTVYNCKVFTVTKFCLTYRWKVVKYADRDGSRTRGQSALTSACWMW